ncbi:hypothetical protein [Helicobacter muridarum]|uniref:hypothetical protein n=1 Tax=Helicobacter muridarum TaxID=216 RepID=UPI000CF1380E|nr:hypothetical protein [Helicobacter muridarum]
MKNICNKTNVVQYLIQTKDKLNDAIAIEDKNSKISYGEFYTQALYISSNILELCRAAQTVESKSNQSTANKTISTPPPPHIYQ